MLVSFHAITCGHSFLIVVPISLSASSVGRKSLVTIAKEGDQEIKEVSIAAFSHLLHDKVRPIVSLALPSG